MKNLTKTTRRDFLEATMKNGAGLAALSGISFLTQPEKVRGANDRVRIGVVGVRGQGFVHVEGFSAVAASTAAVTVFTACRAPKPSARPKRTTSMLEV